MSNPLLDTLRSSLGREYAIERELGGGGMARVFLAEERSLGRRVVLKVLPPDAAGSVSAERFKREVQVAARLQHPHIVPLISAGEVNGIPYYTMPYIEGESLRARIAREHELPIAVAVRIMREVADALAYAHSNNVVHRDIKPDNVLLADQHALVADFGIAKAIASARATSAEGTAVASITQLGVALGTPAYMAPEQASADPNVDHRADIYALGALGYELLTGRPPFTGHSPQALLAAVISSEAQPVTTLRVSVPPALGQLIMRCLEKRPADRPQSAGEVLRELEAQATPTGLSTAALPSAQRGGRAWIAVAAAVLVVVAGATGLALMRQSPVASSASVISVMPFVPSSPDSALTRLGRDLVVTVSANLDGVGTIRATDPLTTLGLTGASTVSAASAAAIAKKLGAGSFVLGSILRAAGRVQVSFGLYPVVGSEPLARGTVSAPLDSISAISDSLTWSMLRQIWRRDKPPTPSVAAMTTKSMVALRAYLEGERARADGRFIDAIAAFDRSIDADSTFWLAYWRDVTTRGWMFYEVDTVLNRYREHVAELPELDRAMFAAGTTRSVSNRIAAYHLVAERFPDAWGAWESSGDLMFHDGPTVGLPIDRARADLERAVTLNPRLTEAWQHLLLIARLQDGPSSAAADSVTRLMRGMGYDSASTQTLGFSELRFNALIDGLSADSAAIHSPLADSVLAGMARGRMSPLVASFFASSPLLYPSGAMAVLALSGRALGAGLSDRDAKDHRAAIEWAWTSRGAYDSALAKVGFRARVAQDTSTAIELLRIAALAEFSGAVPGAFELRWGGASSALSRLSRPSQSEAYWMRGALAALRRDTVTLGAASASLSRLAADTAARIPRYLSRELRAFAAETHGDKASAADSLMTVELDIAENDAPAFPTAIARSTASRWLQSLGRNEDAAKLLVWHEGIVPNRSFWSAMLMFQPLVLLDRGRLAEARGEFADARRFYGEFLERFDMPMPAHKPLVAEARTALARLAKKGG